ncbi:MAG: diguanylate cyclase [Syntrophales bacterium]|nr:diguanylate cyclase [Syntrophales bacterium]MDD5233132.1 diguanylate cyclase [Syntrophales bacterium]MDD5531318.1 diguanylate cyclase [Syntrophales bacterium]
MTEYEKGKTSPAAQPLSPSRPESAIFSPSPPVPEIGEMAFSLLLNFQGIAFRCDLNFAPIFLLGAVKAISGYSPEDFFSGKADWGKTIRGGDIVAYNFQCLIDTFEREYSIAQPGGKIRWVRELDQKLCTAEGRPIIQGMIYDITERKTWEEALKNSEEKYRTLVESSTDVILLLLLKAVGARLRETLRKTDTVARMCGDEFMLLLSDLENKEDTLKIARKVIAAFRTPFDAGGRLLHITPSIGISVYPDDGDTFEVLAKNADIAMYHAKETGRNSYELYTPRLEYHY